MVTGASNGARVAHPDRRPQGRDRADAAPRLLVLDAGRPAHGRLRQQDGPDRLGPRPVRADRVGLHGVRRPPERARHHVHPDLGAERRQRGAALRGHVVVRRVAPAEPPRVGLHRQRRELHRPAVPGAVRDPEPDAGQPRLPGLRRDRGVSGVLRPGDEVLVLPTGTTSRIESIVTADGEVAEAFPPMAVVVTLEDDIAVSRGDVLCRPNNRPTNSHDIEATVCWMDERSSLAVGRTYLLKHSTRTVRATVRVAAVPARHQRPAPRRDRHDARAQRDRPRVVPHAPSRCSSTTTATNRTTGSFIVIDPQTNATVGRGRHPRPRHDARQPQRGAPPRAASPGTTASARSGLGARRCSSRACPGRASRRSPPGWRRPTCRAAATPSCSTATTCGTASTATSASPTRTARRTCAGPARWPRMFAESGSLALIALICPFEEDRRLIRMLHDDAGLAVRSRSSWTPRSRSASGATPRASTPGPGRASCRASPGSTRTTSRRPGPTWCWVPGGLASEQVSRVLELLEELLR